MMQASMQTRGASVATAGALLRSVARASAPASESRFAPLWSKLVSSAWIRPAAKFILLVLLLAGLSWIGSRASAFGLNMPNSPATSSSIHVASLLNDTAPAQAPFTADGGAAQDAATEVRAQSGVLPDGRIVLNLATEDDLRKLPKVGQKRAQAIIALRQRMGRFRSARDLLRVKGIGLRSLQKIQPMVVVDPATESPDAGR